MGATSSSSISSTCRFIGEHLAVQLGQTGVQSHRHHGVKVDSLHRVDLGQMRHIAIAIICWNEQVF